MKTRIGLMGLVGVLRNVKLVAAGLGLAVGAFLSGGASAAVGCSSQTGTVPDGRESPALTTSNVAPVGLYFAGAPGHSYSVEVHGVSQNSQALPFILAVDTAGVAPCPGINTSDVVPRNTQEPSTSPAGASSSVLDQLKSSVIVGGSAPSYVYFTVTGSPGPTLVVARVSETTLYNPLWTTFGGFQTFYQVQNTSSQACKVVITLTSAAGVVVGTKTLPAVPANSAAPTVNTGPTDMNVLPNQAGSATIAHDCSPGAILVDGFSGNFSGAAAVVLPIKIFAVRESMH